MAGQLVVTLKSLRRPADAGRKAEPFAVVLVAWRPSGGRRRRALVPSELNLVLFDP